MGLELVFLGIGFKIFFYLLVTLILAIIVIIIAKIGSSEGGFGLAFGSAILILLVFFVTNWLVELTFTFIPTFPFPIIITWIITALFTFVAMWAVYCKTKFDMSGAGGFFAALFTAVIFVITVFIFTLMFTVWLFLFPPDVLAGFNFI